MTGDLYLDWAAMAVSLFNTFLLLWLGLTVLLNAERRTWGVWLTGGGLLTGGAFFVSHTAILSYGLNYLGTGVDFWWRVGWVPVVISPLTWYVAMLWYAGFWDGAQTALRRRQRWWFLLTALLVAGLLGMLAANALPSFRQVTSLALPGALAPGGVPLLILIYPAYIVLCVLLSLDALRRPGPSTRVMGDLARRRARHSLARSRHRLAHRRFDRPAGTGRRLLRDLYRPGAPTARFFPPLAQCRHPGRRVQHTGGLEPDAPTAPRLRPAAEHAAGGGVLRALRLALLRRARTLHRGPAPLHRQPAAVRAVAHGYCTA